MSGEDCPLCHHAPHVPGRCHVALGYHVIPICLCGDEVADRPRDTSSSPAGCLAIGGAADLGEMVPGEVRIATWHSARLQVMPGGEVLVDGVFAGRDARVHRAIRGLFAMPGSDPGARSLVWGEDDARATPCEARPASGVWGSVAIGRLACATETGDIVFRNRLGRTWRLRRDGSCFGEDGELGRDEVVPQLASVLVRSPARWRVVAWPLVGLLVACAFAGVVVALLVGASCGVATEKIGAWIKEGR
jgi:hypothetical protein